MLFRRQFYAYMWLLLCVGFNMVYFSEVRGPIFGDDDPLKSVQSAIPECDIKTIISQYCPPLQSTMEYIQAITSARNIPPAEPKGEGLKGEGPKGEGLKGEEQEQEKAAEKSVNTPTPEPATSDPITDPLLSPIPPQKTEPKSVPEVAPKESIPKESIPKESIPKESAPKESAPKETIPHETPPKKAPPQEPEPSKPTRPMTSPAEHLHAATPIPVPRPVAAHVKPVIADQFKPILTSPTPTEIVKPSSNTVWDTVDTALDQPIRYDR